MGYKLKSGSFAGPSSYVPHGPYVLIPEISAINVLSDVQVPQVSSGYHAEAVAISGNQVQVKIYNVVVGGSGSSQAMTEIASGTSLSGTTITVRAKGY